MNIDTFFIQFKNEIWNERMKFILLFMLFLFQIMTSIISVFYMEELLDLFGFELITSITPTGEAAYKDFLGDQLLFGIIIMALGTMSIFARSLENGSISFSLARPISRSEYAFAKIIARIIALVTPFFIASIIGWIYMAILFDILRFEKLLWSIIPLGMLLIYFGVTTSALSTRASTISTGLFAIGIFIFQFTLSTFEPLELLSPFTPANIWVDILSNTNIQLNMETLMKIGLLGGWIIIPFVIAIYSLKTRDI